MDTTNLIVFIVLALIATIIAVFLMESRMKTASLLVMIAAGCLIFLRLLPSLSLLFDSFSTLSERAGVSSDYLSLLLKIIGLAYLAEFGAQLCRDAGEGAAALKIEFAAKITILLLALPLIASVIQAVLRLLD